MRTVNTLKRMKTEPEPTRLTSHDTDSDTRRHADLHGVRSRIATQYSGCRVHVVCTVLCSASGSILLKV